ncbi:YdeI/OmpD-associated family protein [Fibrella arboris]|uniref:YdeI/OmpD-associated family protein n=1 Tax=Fibrella arboris TaxID=3242486 RepID=UPI003520077F
MSVSFKTTLLKFGQNGEKTGWTYIEVPPSLTETLKPGQRTSFRVKGLLDAHPIRQIALLPMGDGLFILVVNATMRRAIRKEEGASVQVTIEADDEPFTQSADLLECLADDPAAQDFFDSLAPGHQRYYTNWIESAKTPQTKAKRIAQAITGFSMGMGYGEMIRYGKKRSQEQ